MMLISEAYRAEQQALHARGNYGTASLQFGGIVSQIIGKTKPKDLLDYGCGSMQNLATVVSFDDPCQYRGYDPGVSEFAAPPDAAELVCCIDVLEHIEPECLDAVLLDLKALTLKHGFFTVHTGPAVKTLSDGRNAHLIQLPGAWWFTKLAPLFEVVTYQKLPNGCFFIVGAI